MRALSDPEKAERSFNRVGSGVGQTCLARKFMAPGYEALPHQKGYQNVASNANLWTPRYGDDHRACSRGKRRRCEIPQRLLLRENRYKLERRRKP
jgi:hypothetical protein